MGWGGGTREGVFGGGGDFRDVTINCCYLQGVWYCFYLQGVCKVFGTEGRHMSLQLQGVGLGGRSGMPGWQEVPQHRSSGGSSSSSWKTGT
jgi:hypothetical protein